MWYHQRSRNERDRLIDRLSGISGTVKTEIRQNDTDPE